MRLVFMGTPAIAAAALHALLQAGHEVAAVYTRADKPVGRKQVLTAPPVKELAAAQGIPVFQPKTLRDGQETGPLAALAPEAIVVVAYGLLLPKEVLEIPRYGCLNLHVSLLPKYRGAAPIQWAVIQGEVQTGVSVMKMNEGLDTGDVLATGPVEIGPETTAGELLEAVAPVGGQLLVKTLEDLQTGRTEPCAQTGEPCWAPPLDKEMAQIDFARPAAALHNLARGCNPWPLAWFLHKGKKIKVMRTKQVDARGAPGRVASEKPLVICCGEGALELLELRPEGKNAMAGAAWAMGRRLKVDDKIADDT